MIRVGLGIVAVVLACAGTAHADRIASTGFFAEGGFGAVQFLPSVSTDAALGPAMSLRVGRDLFSWLSLGGYVAASSHEATTPPPPQNQWFQLYRAGADGRLNVKLDRVSLFGEGGAGVAVISSNVLEKVMVTKPGKPYSLAIHGGGGVEYQLENRHYALGAALDIFVEPQFATMKEIEMRLYLRYTYGGG